MTRLNPRSREIVTRAGKTVRADVANVIPQQRAGEIAVRAGCTEGGWCPVHPGSFLSRQVPDIYVLGDAAIAEAMPKSASAANSQAKVVAADILAKLTKAEPLEPSYRYVCWSLLAPEDSVKRGADYTPAAGRLEAAAAFASQPGEPADLRKQNYQESVAWYAGITDDIFAKTVPLPEKAVPPPEKLPRLPRRRAERCRLPPGTHARDPVPGKAHAPRRHCTTWIRKETMPTKAERFCTTAHSESPASAPGPPRRDGPGGGSQNGISWPVTIQAVTNSARQQTAISRNSLIARPSTRYVGTSCKFMPYTIRAIWHPAKGSCTSAHSQSGEHPTPALRLPTAVRRSDKGLPARNARAPCDLRHAGRRVVTPVRGR